MTLSTESYKGVRDFFPRDKFIHDYIFNIMAKTVESYGYVSYDASILEPSELYEAKSGEEIVNEQTYSFIDRGERKVTLRPEMTPTVARMIAAKRREIPMPARWYSIPNLFRYERPQRGRMREHWQLNADIFGVDSLDAELEIILMSHKIMKNFGLKDENFSIQINNRKLFQALTTDYYKLDETTSLALGKLIDRKKKVSDFDEQAEKLIGKKFEFLPGAALEIESVKNAKKDIDTLLEKLSSLGVTNAVFDQEIMRGFDYYTGIVFEVFDTHPDNNRALFGGGRYDDLLALFGSEKIPAVGFGMGDVTMQDVLETYNLIPEYISTTSIALCPMNESVIPFAQKLAEQLRNQKISVAIDLSGKKVGDQIKKADKDGVTYCIVLGEEEEKTKSFKLKHLKTGEEVACTVDTIKSHLV